MKLMNVRMKMEVVKMSVGKKLVNINVNEKMV
jgi:hypothetical protein